ncbi:hypothetical protein Lser_V15G20288 [Lactuca serriola]
MSSNLDAVSRSPHCSHLRPCPSRSPPSPTLEPHPLSSSVNRYIHGFCRRTAASCQSSPQHFTLHPCDEDTKEEEGDGKGGLGVAEGFHQTQWMHGRGMGSTASIEPSAVGGLLVSNIMHTVTES